MKNSPPPTPQIEWTARFNNGNGGASIAIDGRSVFVTGEQARELAAALVGPPRAALGETSEEWSARVRSMTRDERRAAADSTCAPLEAAALAVSAGITQAARTVIDPRNGDAVRIVLTRFKPGTPEHGANIDGAASVNDRTSIVAFLSAEAKRLRGDGQSPAAWKGGPDATVRLEDERIVIAFPSPDGKWQHAYSHTAEEAATLHTRLSAALRQRTDALGVDDAAPAKPSADELLRSIIDELLRKIDRMPCTAHDFLGTALYTKAAQAVGAPWVEEVDQ